MSSDRLSSRVPVSGDAGGAEGIPRGHAAEEAGAHQADAQDRDAHLARREAHAGHAPAAGEAQRLGAGAGVADHERVAHGDRRQPRAQVEARPGCSR